MLIIFAVLAASVSAGGSISGIDEAISLANDSEYGLGASIMTGSLEYAMRAAERIKAGIKEKTVEYVLDALGRSLSDRVRKSAFSFQEFRRVGRI